MSRIYSYEFRALLQAQRRGLLVAGKDGAALRDIDTALDRLARGGYGVCLGCGGDIGRERLKLHPTSERCASCDAREGEA